MLKKSLLLSLYICSILFLTSWTSVGKSENTNTQVKVIPTEMDFFRDAYNFKIKNGYPVPDHYYDILKIDNPNTPAWVKTPAEAPPKRVSPIPEWILKGILMRETKSYYDKNGNIVYIDKTVGSSGERGPFQITPIAFLQIKKKGEIHSKVTRDMVYAQDMSERYLLWLYNGPANKNWDTAIRMYNGGPSKWRLNATLEYLRDVKRIGNKN